METKKLSTEDKGTLLYNVMRDTLETNNASQWQEKIIDVIREIGLTNAEINSDCLYWLMEIYRMFGKIGKIEPYIMD
mgnify:CR=1 FL=1|jgi:hypothetical protein